MTLQPVFGWTSRTSLLEYLLSCESFSVVVSHQPPCLSSSLVPASTSWWTSSVGLSLLRSPSLTRLILPKWSEAKQVFQGSVGRHRVGQTLLTLTSHSSLPRFIWYQGNCVTLSRFLNFSEPRVTLPTSHSLPPSFIPDCHGFNMPSSLSWETPQAQASWEVGHPIKPASSLADEDSNNLAHGLGDNNNISLLLR